jgi:EF-P beta-lysylation protein EpmB
LRDRELSILTNPQPFVRAGSSEPGWRRELREAVRNGHELCRRLGLPVRLADGAAASDFPVFVPPSYLARIRPGDPDDPLLRQVLPVAAEGEAVPGFVRDPVDDAAAQLHPGVLQKYRGRALLVATGACAVHCRYCFRRHFAYDDAPRSAAEWEEALRAIADDDSIEEVILSGGDPLVLGDGRLERMAAAIAAMPHVLRLRIHTRLPIMIPARVTDQLLGWLCETRLAPIVVLHANHAQELDDEVAQAVDRLRYGGVMLLNQAVLLRRVNDSIQAQANLSRRLLEIGVVPYYLHQLDRVAGAAHFEVPVAEGLQIVAALREQLPGYAVPRYVQEIPGDPAKHVLA